MIKGIIIVNNHGQARICEFFQSVHEEGYSAEDAQQQVVRKVFQQLESDLGILDLIQVFVEALDKCFENVCELDLIFHSDKVHYILGEIVMAGMVLETNIVSILQGVDDQNKPPESLSKLGRAPASRARPRRDRAARRAGPI
ncbi:hypothetical protein JL721_7979 [Aureococcus anophagefferens]|nr:hypothetical protein JL721_7979 [Aureococcus anophagefferens]